MTSTASDTAAGCCEDCGGALTVPIWGGRGYCLACAEADRIAREAVEREDLARRKAQAERDELVRRLAAEVDGIPAKYRGADFKNCDANNPAVAAVMAWAKEPKGMVLIYGQCGRGKTYLAAAAKREFNRREVKSSFYCEDEILVTIKSTFNSAAKMTEGEAYDLFTSPAPLIIDDLGASRVSEFTLDVWDVVLGRRYREEYPTLITSNCLPVERGRERALIDRIGDRAFDRIRESKMMFKLDGDNRRAV